MLSSITSGFAQSRTVGALSIDPSQVAEGYTLVAPMFGPDTRTFLIDNCGDTVHSWPTSLPAGLSAKLLPNGDLLRPAVGGTSPINGGGYTGIVQIWDWDGNLVWDYPYVSNDFRAHHEAIPMPNGNIMILAWERKDSLTSVLNGRNPANLPDKEIWAETLIEVQPTGPNTGTIVWEWDIFDHLIQDFDPTKLNYGVVADHPEKLDINYLGWSFGQKDWLHANAIDYNPFLDQIVISCRHSHEIYIIDHSTTTAEAAGSTGGIRGKGGDFLYRYGNPAVYQRGTTMDQQLWGQHNCHWIDTGLVDAGKIMIFNNGASMPGYDHSSVDIINPPTDGNGNYLINPNSPYGPSAPEWSYEAPNPQDFYSSHIAGAQRLPNGNTLICEGTKGRIFEINPQQQKVWEYMNPVGLSGVLAQGSTPAPYAIGGTNNWVFRALKYPSTYSAFANRSLIPGAPIEANPLTSICEVAAIYSNPAAASGCAGTPAMFVVGAQGAVNGYQWQEDTGSGFVNVPNTGVYSGADNDTLWISDITGLNGAQYRVIGMGATSADNDTSSPVALTVKPLPAVEFSTVSTMCVDDGAVTLSATPADGIFSGTGVTGNTFDPQATGPGTFTITYSYTDTNTCTSVATDTIVVDPCVGMDEVAVSWFNVKPNPSAGIVTVSKDKEDAQSIYIFNAIGKLVMTRAITGKEQQVDLTALADGVYFIRCESKVAKIVIKK